MKNIPLYIYQNMGKLGKKVCSDVIYMVKIWKNTGKFGKIQKQKIFTEVFTGFLPAHFRYAGRDFYHFTHFTRKKTDKKYIIDVSNGCYRVS